MVWTHYAKLYALKGVERGNIEDYIRVLGTTGERLTEGMQPLLKRDFGLYANFAPDLYGDDTTLYVIADNLQNAETIVEQLKSAYSTAARNVVCSDSWFNIGRRAPASRLARAGQLRLGEICALCERDKENLLSFSMKRR